MNASSAGDITDLLRQWSGGRREALDELVPRLQHELHRLARSAMRREARGHTLQPTALVNEAYLRLFHQSRIEYRNRAHFLALAATMMRRILVDHARRAQRGKRGGKALHVPLEDAHAEDRTGPLDLLDLDRALARLGALDARLSRVVELRYFGGLDVRETAILLEISPATVKRDWATARAWLLDALTG